MLCCDWSSSEVSSNYFLRGHGDFTPIWFTQVIASGGADNDMKVFKASNSEALKIDEA